MVLVAMETVKVEDKVKEVARVEAEVTNSTQTDKENRALNSVEVWYSNQSKVQTFKTKWNT